MPEPMSLANWLKLTNAGLTSIRGSKLNAVDSALERYQKSKTQPDKERLRSALMAWIMDLGPGWQRDVRNKYNAISDLHSQVMDVPGLEKSRAGVVALSHLQDEQRAALDTLFRNKKLLWRNGFFTKLGNCKWAVTMNTPMIAKNSYSLAKAATTPAASSSVAEGVIDALVPAEIRGEVMSVAEKVIPGFSHQLAAAVTPFVGVITAATGTLWNLKNAIRSEYRRDQSEKHMRGGLAVAEPAQAIQSIVRMIERERNSDVFSASVSFGEFVGKLAGTLADGGTATGAALGLASSVAKLGNTVRIIVRDVQEKNAANRLMANGLRVTIFETCPVVGAYYVCCVPTSVLVNEIFDRFWQGGWRGDVEHTVTNHIEPLREQARRLIHDHRFVIPELQRYPGVLTVNKKALEEMASRTGKTGMTGFGSNG